MKTPSTDRYKYRKAPTTNRNTHTDVGISALAAAIKIAMFYGGNPDRLKAIEDAGNKVAKEKRWQE